MSRIRLFASLIVISCCVTFVITLGARALPLKGVPLITQSEPSGGVAGGSSGGLSGGVPGRIDGGIGGQSAAQPVVERNSIWTATVKRGPMVRQVRGLGTIVSAKSSDKFVARVTLPGSLTAEIRPEENATIDTHQGLVKGHVLQVKGSSPDETRTVDVVLDGPLPQGAGVNLAVDAVIDIGKLDDVLWVLRPANGAANTTKPLFKITADGMRAERVKVSFGRASVQTIEVRDGLKVGDNVILSDMSHWEKFELIQIK